MLSKIMVEIDFDTMQPLLRIKQDLKSEVLADKTLNHFIQKASLAGSNLYVTYPDYVDRVDNSIVEIRCQAVEKTPDVALTDEQMLENKFVRISATYLEDWGDGHKPYKKGEPYNLMFGIGKENCILIKHYGRDGLEGSFRKYHDLSQFLSYWNVNKSGY